ncbi:hypothetical protein YQE_02221, partial [Dendroctonus ponderosae]
MWKTVCITLPIGELKQIMSALVKELIAQKVHNPLLQVASAVMERIWELMGEPTNAGDKRMMASEARRRETFSQWPHMDYKWALPEQMAQAGFYHQPNTAGDDRAMCFTCTVCLVSWERTDEPWSEHERHSPTCPFVIGEYTQNVPISVSKATEKVSVHKRVTALSIVSDKAAKEKAVTKSVRPTIICGITISQKFDKNSQVIRGTDLDRDVNNTTGVYLVVYDFMFNKEQEEPEDKSDNSKQSEIDCDKQVTNAPLAYNHISLIDIDSSDLSKKDEYVLLKELTSFYKTLIPGESDSVFLPPVTKTNDSPKKNHTGPRLLTVDINNSEADFVSASDMLGFLPPYQPDSNETSISDHIVDLKNNQSNKRLNYSRTVQCISLPVGCKRCKGVQIKSILTTQDGAHILVTVCSTSAHFLIVYALNFSNKMVTIDENYLNVRHMVPEEKPVEISLLPSLDKLKMPFAKLENGIEGNVIIVCADGAVRIIELSTLKTACIAKIDDKKFVSAVYCNSLDRLCVSTSEGSLHFYELNEGDYESTDDHEEDDIFPLNADQSVKDMSAVEKLDIIRCFKEPPAPIPLKDLKTLQKLTLFSPVRSGYNVTVPPCWSEFQQAMRQRRNTSIINTESSTKTWRLQTDTTTWEEHIFEIALPTPVHLGHVDVHFTLQSGCTKPRVEVSLLRQSKGGIGRRHGKDVKFSVDDSVTIDMLRRLENPVVSEEYLRAHNADLLVGPVSIGQYLDLTDQSGIVTLTSPRLFKVKVRNLLLHIRAVFDKDAKKPKDSKGNVVMDKLGIPTRKNTQYLGCDCIHELSIALYGPSENPQIIHERIMRNLMLDSNVFVQSLLNSIITSNNRETHQKALDILNWIASIKLVPSKRYSVISPDEQVELIFTLCIDENMLGLLRKCLLRGSRSIAHNCMLFLLTCSRETKNISDSFGNQFDNVVLRNLLTIMTDIKQVKSPLALQWLFALLLKMTKKDTEQLVGDKCISLLKETADELIKRSNPFHLLLRSRYGLYGLPTEPEIFDIEPPTFVKDSCTNSYYNFTSTAQNAVPATEASGIIIGPDYTQEVPQKTDSPPRDTIKENKLKNKHIFFPRPIKGLIEAEPLHFSCINTSEGTRIEMADSVNATMQTAVNNIFPIVLAATQPTQKETKKEDFQSFVQKYMDTSPCFSSHLNDIIENNFAMSKAFEEAEQKMDIIIPSCSDLVSLTIDVWLFGEEVDSVRLVTSSDIGTKNLILNDLQPPPLCRFMRVTLVGRYGMSTTRCRIPLGYFYGHVIILPEDVPGDIYIKPRNYEKQLGVLSKLLEDISCRYSLVCSKLKDYLQPFLIADVKNTCHLSSYLRTTQSSYRTGSKTDEQKLISAYTVREITAKIIEIENCINFVLQDAVTYQLQMNTVRNVMSRIEEGMTQSASSDSGSVEATVSTDKLNFIAEGLLEVLLSVDKTAQLPQDLCQHLFKGLCVSEPARIQLLGAMFLEKSSGSSLFWGNFLADTLVELFSTSSNSVVQQDRLFVLLIYLSRKSPENSAKIDAAMRVVYKTLKPIETNRSLLLAVNVDLPFLSWLLMYLSLQLTFDKREDDRWEWVHNEITSKLSTTPSADSQAKVKILGSWKNNTSWSTVKEFKTSKGGIFKKTPGAEASPAEDKLWDPTSLIDLMRVPQSKPQFVDTAHCLAVARLLLKFINSMDHSASADMMILSFKIISKLATMAKLQLWQLLTESQLLNLIHFTLACKVHWAPFALLCFLQDALDLQIEDLAEVMEVDREGASSSSWGSSTVNELANEDDSDTSDKANSSLDSSDASKTKSKPMNNLSFPPLPSVFETDSNDSDIEEVLETFEKVKPAVQMPAKLTFDNSKFQVSALPTTCTTIDARLEIGLSSMSEIGLQRLTTANTHKLLQNVLEDRFVETECGLLPWPEQVDLFAAESTVQNAAQMLSYCFDQLLNKLQTMNPDQIEDVLHLWVTLNCIKRDSKFDSSATPIIQIQAEPVVGLISALAWTPGLSLKAWCLGLQALTLVCNAGWDGGSSFSATGMLSTIVNHRDFVQLFVNFLSGSGIAFRETGAAGPTLCKALHDFLSILYLDFTNIDISIGMSTLESASLLLNHYFTSIDNVKCLPIGDKRSIWNNNFSDIFAGVLGTDATKPERSVSYEDLLINLLKLFGKLAQTPMVYNSNSSGRATNLSEPSAFSQTDESKAEQINQFHADNLPSQLVTPFFADTVLQHHPTIISLYVPLKNILSFSEPTSVEEAIFQFLCTLVKKATRRELVMEPLLMFLSQKPDLNRLLTHFIHQVLDNEEAVACFYNAGGIQSLASNVVSSINVSSSVSKRGTITTVLEFFNKGSSYQHENEDPTHKSCQNTPELCGLINFAPSCTITCQSITSQPADVLIQGGSGVTHRRSRSALWSHNLYQDETHTDLLLELPTAVLLKEVQLQPHASSLATCPSYVAIETSADGPRGLVPACYPLATSGMTSIRLGLPSPKVVNCVLIRLYKPKVAGILLLHGCFMVAVDPQLRRQIVESASLVPNFLNTCCSMLLVPSQMYPGELPYLESVLRELSLFSPENGMATIRNLLDNRLSIVEPMLTLAFRLQDKVIENIPGSQSACELLYQILEHQDANTGHRVDMVLKWLKATADECLRTGNTRNCSPTYVSSIASILWFSKEAEIGYDLKELITLDLFDAIYNLKMRTTNNSLKYTLDCLLCSVCYIRSELFPLLLQKVGVLVPNLSTDRAASISDDRKDAEGMTDDHKEDYANCEWYGHLIIRDLSELDLSQEQLETVALASRSPTAIQQLLDSGLPKLLNNAIHEFCNKNDQDSSVPMAKLEQVAAILQFFTNACDEKMLRDWLGSPDGSSFWPQLLHWLCKNPFNSANMQSEALVHLEEICVKFLSKCCLCHPTNQARLATVLCEVISLQQNDISGFLRRLILQLLLENEKVPVIIEANFALYQNFNIFELIVPVHPAFKQTHHRRTSYMSTSTCLGEILEGYISCPPNASASKSESVSSKKSSTISKKDTSHLKDFYVAEFGVLSMAAGNTAKDKRAKDIKNLAAVTPQSKKKRYASETLVYDIIEGRCISCQAFPGEPLPLSLNLGQLLLLIESKNITNNWPFLHLTVSESTSDERKHQTKEAIYMVQQQHPICNALLAFSSIGGLALLAQHLPTVYPEAIRVANPEKTMPDFSESEWIKLEDADDLYEDIEEVMSNSASPSSTGTISQIPPHSLTAFSLFLRLPGYADVLLKDTKKAICLLRLMLGVTDDGEGRDMLQWAVASSLATFPFEVLRQLYDVSPLCSDDGRLLRRISISSGAVQLILSCLGLLTHHSSTNHEKDSVKNQKTKEERQLYWAKGGDCTGFGTGSTQQSWNVEQALMKQKTEEEHVTVLLDVLASYINPNDEAGEELVGYVLPPQFPEMLAKSALLPAISSYLRNDSVLDMARHIPLYKAVLKVLRALALIKQLAKLLLPQNSECSELSVSSLLNNMRTCVDTYASKLRIQIPKSERNGKASKSDYLMKIEELEQGEGLATLMPDIQTTATLVANVTLGLDDQIDGNSDCSLDRPVDSSPEEQYIRIMKQLQFASHDMMEEQEDGTVNFTVTHHFQPMALATPEQSHPARVKRIAQETVTLSTSLPLSYSSSVFVLITGPADTPYANGCFELDVFFPPDYPLSPMLINLETTGHHTVRFNPNLYNDGKVCLSVLNTWHGRPEEKWNAQTSSFLQVLVSIQSLILVPEPYFNEPGYERARGTPAGSVNSKDYNLNICQATVRWAMLDQILNPCPCFEDVINAHFYMKKHEVLAQVEKWIEELELEVKKEKKSGPRIIKKNRSAALDSFRKLYKQLREQLAKLKPPGDDYVEMFLTEGIELDSPTTPTNSMEVCQEEIISDFDPAGDMEKMVDDMCK